MVQLKFFLEYKRSAGIGSSAPATLDWISGREWMEYMDTWDHMPHLFKTPLEVVLISNFCSLNQRGACFSLQTQRVIYRNFTPKRAQQQKCTSSGKKINPTEDAQITALINSSNEMLIYCIYHVATINHEDLGFRPRRVFLLIFVAVWCQINRKTAKLQLQKNKSAAFPLNQVALVVILHHLALKAPRLLKFDVIK